MLMAEKFLQLKLTLGEVSFSSIGLPYFQRKKGGQFTTVTYVSVLSTLISQITNRPID